MGILFSPARTGCGLSGRRPCDSPPPQLTVTPLAGFPVLGGCRHQPCQLGGGFCPPTRHRSHGPGEPDQHRLPSALVSGKVEARGPRQGRVGDRPVNALYVVGPRGQDWSAGPPPRRTCTPRSPDSRAPLAAGSVYPSPLEQATVPRGLSSKRW